MLFVFRSDARGLPKLLPLGRRERSGELVLCRARRAVMTRLIALAETTPHLASAIEVHQARTLHRCIDGAREVLLDARLGGPDGAVAWLFRFREAALLLDKAARIGP